MSEYDALKRRLAQGWNTWNTRSVLSHVLLPDGFALNLGFKERASRRYLKEALIGRRGEQDEQIHPGPRTYDGRYTELTLTWQGMEVLVQSATVGEERADLVLLVTPHSCHRRAPVVVVEPGFLWNRPGYVTRDGETLIGHCSESTVAVTATVDSIEDPYIAAQTSYLVLPLQMPVGISTGHPRTLEEIQALMIERRAEHEAYVASFEDLSDVYAAIQTCMAWDTIYEPEGDRVVSPVSRLWNINWGGFVLFDWDTYFAAYMAALDNKDLAYANAIEITREKTERGFIPNFGTVQDLKSRDRSQPPVGALVVRELYRRFGDRWVLEEVFDDLLTWNRWWPANRGCGGLLCWGSDAYTPRADAYWEVHGVHARIGAALESGLDNSPMYDDVPFDVASNLMMLADVGLMGMYVMDCEALADIAGVLSREHVVDELRTRAHTYREALSTLWDEEVGLFLNRRTDTGESSHRLSPTNFYALLGRAATQVQAERMIGDHFYNPDEFWGEWIMPSISRDDPAYPDQAYWRGRIWAPMNFLVYLGLRYYELPEAQADLAERSVALLLKEWLERGHVHENYNAETGEGCDVPNSDRFYHWGGLLGLIAFIEAGEIAGPEAPLGDL
ncbi:MAG: MGH1-like glycoside hydrolase domain-containing protein [Anaerolineae bacterium]